MEFISKSLSSVFDAPSVLAEQDLKQSIHVKLGIPLEDMQLSKDAALLTTKDAKVRAAVHWTGYKGGMRCAA